MQKLQCEVCGSTAIKKISDDIFECQSCGVQYAKNDIKKLLVEITNEIKIDKTQEVENMLKNGIRNYDNGIYDKAYEIFENILSIDAENAEAILYSSLSIALQSSLNNMLLWKAFDGLHSSIEISYNKHGESVDFFRFCENAIKLFLSAEEKTRKFLLGRMFDIASNSNGISGALEYNRKKKEIFDLTAMKISVIILNLSSKIKDFSNAPDGFFINIVKLMRLQYLNGIGIGNTTNVEFDLLLIKKFQIDKEKNPVAYATVDGLIYDFKKSKSIYKIPKFREMLWSDSDKDNTGGSIEKSTASTNTTKIPEEEKKSKFNGTFLFCSCAVSCILSFFIVVGSSANEYDVFLLIILFMGLAYLGKFIYSTIRAKENNSDISDSEAMADLEADYNKAINKNNEKNSNDSSDTQNINSEMYKLLDVPVEHAQIIDKYVRENKIVNAVKVYRDITGAELAVSKDIIDRYAYMINSVK